MTQNKYEEVRELFGWLSRLAFGSNRPQILDIQRFLEDLTNKFPGKFRSALCDECIHNLDEEELERFDDELKRWFYRKMTPVMKTDFVHDIILDINSDSIDFLQFVKEASEYDLSVSINPRLPENIIVVGTRDKIVNYLKEVYGKNDKQIEREHYRLTLNY